MVPKSLLAACCAAGGALALGVQVHQHDDPPSFTVSREISAPEGNSIQFHIEPGCKMKDSHGDNWCDIPWGNRVTFISVADLAEPVRRGDVVRFTGDAWFKASDSAPLLAQSLFTGVKLKAVHECGLCAGKCTIMASSDHGFKSAITAPTFVSRPGACKMLDETMPKHVNLGTFSFQTPPIPESKWEMTSAMDFNLALTTADGTEKASETIHMQLQPHGLRTSLLDVSSVAGAQKAESNLGETLDALALMTATGKRMSSLMQELEGKPVSEGGLLNFWSAMGQSFTDGMSKASIAKSPQDDLKNMKFQLSFKNMKSTAGQTPLTLIADTDCTKELCKIPLGRKSNMSGQAGVRYTLPKGSFVNLKMNLVFEGNQGGAMQQVIEPFQKMFPIKLPACGDSDEEVTATMNNGKSFMYSPPPCGDYTFELLSPATNIFLPQISKSSLPMPKAPPLLGFLSKHFPFDLSGMEPPPFLATVNLDAYHSDGVIPIANVEFKFGLE